MIHIENLSDNTDEDHLRRLLEAYGNVISLRISSRGSGHRFDNFALIELAGKANKAIAELDGKLFEGAILSVQKATESLRQNTKPHSILHKKDRTPPQTNARRHYEVTAVEKIAAPDGMEGDDWYRYELSHGTSKITGFHRGTLEEVTQFATESSAIINERNSSGKSAQSSYRPQQKK